MYAIEEMLRQAFTVSFLLLVPVLVVGVGAGVAMSFGLALFGLKEEGAVYAARLVAVVLAISVVGARFWQALYDLVREGWR